MTLAYASELTPEQFELLQSLLPPAGSLDSQTVPRQSWCSKRVLTGDFSEVLTSLLGAVEELSATTISRLKTKWIEEHQQWQKRSLVGKHYVYVWADGIYFSIPNQDDRQCILVLIGVRDTAEKALLGLEAGFRESELKLNWRVELESLAVSLAKSGA